MRTLEENVEMLSRAIISEAHNDGNQLIVEAKAKAEAILHHAQQQAEAERTRILDQAARDAERLHSQASATAQLKARTMLLEHREKLLDRVFDAAREQLSTVQQWSDYNDIAGKLLREALLQLSAKDVSLQMDDATRKIVTDRIVDDLSKELKITIKVGQPLKNNKGIFAESANGHLNYDNTFETRLTRLQNTLRSPVYHLLMGESL
jgi:V/A-type H+/Na+-transporting ATPase subunit E